MDTLQERATEQVFKLNVHDKYKKVYSFLCVMSPYLYFFTICIVLSICVEYFSYRTFI